MMLSNFLVFLGLVVHSSCIDLPRSCPLGLYCPYGSDCKDSSSCVDNCYVIDTAHQGNGTTGRCEDGTLPGRFFPFSVWGGNTSRLHGGNKFSIAPVADPRWQGLPRVTIQLQLKL